VNDRFVSTAIAFVNAEPHLGFALELVLADALARSLRAHSSVWFTTGTDENSLKSVRAAAALGIGTRELVDRNAAAFRRLADRLGISYDRFVRTSADPDHRSTVERLWEAARADLYPGRYAGLYCAGCEAFLGERDLIGGRCPEHKAEPERIEEENVFFRLSKYVDPIRDRIRSGELLIRPERARDEILSVLDRGLLDLSVSRPADRSGGWGLPVPGDPSQVIYVWFDALANYVTGAGDRWASSRKAHVIGKGIARFHAIYWPAFLLSAGWPLPHEILVHGYLTLDGQKIAKSLGNTIDPNALIERYGVDAVRWYLLRHVRSTEDGDFSERRFEEIYQAELAHGLGNLVGRVIGLCGRLGIGTEASGIDAALEQRIRAAVERFALDEAVSEIWAVVDRTNVFLQERAPWKLPREEAQPVVERAISALRAVSRALAPFLPETARAIAARLDRREAGAPLFEDLRTRFKRT
jgi:methionyl-tRNA synthetase